jgi:ABC-type transport system involved in multi-copper enzyme maturation permease subunit
VIWISWRFQRSVAITLAALALVIIGFTIITGSMQHHDLIQYLSAPCHGQQVLTGCGALNVKLLNIQAYNSEIRIAGFVIAPLVGMILGLLAVVNEVDHRTVRLAWTQSISRNRWFAAKAGVGAAVVTGVLVPVAIVLSWWSGEIRSDSIFGPETFGIDGWVLVAYGLFAFALAMLVGTIIRRVGWTLAATAVLYLAVAVVFPSNVRVHLVTPTEHWSSITATVSKGATSSYSQAFPESAWLLVYGAVPRTISGRPTWNEVTTTEEKTYKCISDYQTKTTQIKAERACYKKFNVEDVAVYIAGDQFWTLQLREGLLYLIAGLALSGGSLLVIRRIEP